MENQKQPTSKFIDCTGHFYGSRVSKSGQYLNVYVVAEVNGKPIRVCIPTAFKKKDGKPYAVSDSIRIYRKGCVMDLPLFTETKKEDPKEKGEGDPLEETIPF